ncbi:MAG: SRPBCC family protein [Thermomicrobiales bacterium]
MGAGYASAERIIPAPAAEIYALLADYHHGHPSILPPAFSDFTVLAGGVGAGTRIRFKLTQGGRTREVEGRVAEPEPGRVLTETYAQQDTVTTFTVDPAVGGSRLRIETTWESRGGIAGFVERLLAPRLLARLYADELDRIEQWARKRHEAGT